jgi:hypothetical protein
LRDGYIKLAHRSSLSPAAKSLTLDAMKSMPQRYPSFLTNVWTRRRKRSSNSGEKSELPLEKPKAKQGRLIEQR